MKKLIIVISWLIISCSGEQKKEPEQAPVAEVADTMRTDPWPALAKRIVNESARIKPGDMVIITGGKHTMSLMEQIAAEVHRKGGKPAMLVTSDVALRAEFTDKPIEYLDDYPAYIPAWYKEADIVIDLPGTEDTKKTYGDVPPEKFAASSKNQEKLGQELSKTKFSNVVVGFPTKQVAETNKIDYAVYEKMHWDAVNADYGKIEEQGSKLIKLMSGARNVKITSPAGTNISFSMGNRKVFKDDGILSDDERNNKDFYARYASLPGGFSDFAPLESSVNGTVVVPKNRCRYEPFTEVSFSIKNGLAEDLKAKEGLDCFTKEMEPYTGQKMMVSSFSIGLNPAQVVMEENADYRPFTAAGLVNLSIGGDNEFYGGAVRATGGYSFPITNATVEVDGTVVVKDGKLML